MRREGSGRLAWIDEEHARAGVEELDCFSSGKSQNAGAFPEGLDVETTSGIKRKFNLIITCGARRV